MSKYLNSRYESPDYGLVPIVWLLMLLMVCDLAIFGVDCCNAADPTVPSPETIITGTHFTPEQARLLKEAAERADERTRIIKIMTRELIDLMKFVVIILLVIALGFPLGIWWLGRKRLLDFSGRSSGLASALVEVEERQAKLLGIFKDLQDEMEFLNVASAPDLKGLVERAKLYIENNEGDLNRIRNSKFTSKEVGLKQLM